MSSPSRGQSFVFSVTEAVTDDSQSPLPPTPERRQAPRPSLLSSPRKMKHQDRVKNLMYMPEPFQNHNGWQTKCEDLKSRTASLFNCYTMSDVTFKVDVYTIPAHKFVLASASPEFFKQLYLGEERETASDAGDQGRSVARQRTHSIHSDANGEYWSGDEAHLKKVVVNITDVPYLAFFEFLQFLYTDQVNITLENVLPLLFLADSYKVAGISDRCLDFLRTSVVPIHVLKVLKLLRTMLLKVCCSRWREVVEQKKFVHKFRQLSLAERRARLEEMNAADARESFSGGGQSSRSYRKGFSSGKSRSSVFSHSLSGRSSSASMYQGPTPRLQRGSTLGGSFYADHDPEDSSANSVMMDSDEAGSVIDMAQGFSRKTFLKYNFEPGFGGFRGCMMDHNIAGFVFEVMNSCWKCVQDHMEVVISCEDIFDQDIKMFRQILSLDYSCVPEIELFHAMKHWAEKTCQKQGLTPNAENMREVIGGGATLQLIRFPAMTVEQLKWEVVPTGMLEYNDVHQLLYTMTKRKAMMGLYNHRPRFNKQSLKRLSLKPGSGAGLPDPPTIENANYIAAPGDHLDSLLKAELLRTFLEVSRREFEDISGTVAMKGPSLGLPPIGGVMSPRSVFGSPNSSVFESSSRLSTARLTSGGASPRSSSNSISRQGSHMVMGQLLDEEIGEDGVKHAGGGKRPQAEDFVRVTTGFYIFREERVIELVLEGGEAMVYDHGPHPELTKFAIQELASIEVPDSGEEVERVAKLRKLLGLSTAPLRTKGYPLASFLCRQ
mmetsp:Transcript_34121/g.72632  ORF Transcript_34121/g.72632 Transcript_34121/m.72632 type:complete len:776 (-) Transcript_34121:41-2368(-)